MPRRAAKLLPLLTLLRVMLVALALQLSGSAPALARVVDVVREEIAPQHACPCCVAHAERERAEREADRGRVTLRDADHGCCGSAAPGGGCTDRCASCSARDSKSFTNEAPLVIAVAEPVARIAAGAAAIPEPPSVQPPSIFRPPCA